MISVDTCDMDADVFTCVVIPFQESLFIEGTRVRHREESTVRAEEVKIWGGCWSATHLGEAEVETLRLLIFDR
jgi:hypothetical protein